MAGMFSMLNSKFRADGMGHSSQNSGREEGGIGAKSGHRLRANASKHQLYLMNSNSFKGRFLMTYPKELGRHRCFEIHPKLRRSVCTLILAFLGIICGIIVILIEYFVFGNFMSILGVVTLISSLVMVVIGLMWLHHSKQKLIKKWTRREESRQNKLKNMSAAYEKSNILPLTLMTSKHVAKWPSRKNCVLDECRETMTSPNGNHYVTPIDSSCSDTEEEVTSPDRKCEDILFQPKSSGHKIKPFSKDTKLKTSRDNFTDYHGSFRITKNGDYFPVATTEQHLNRFQRTSTMDDDEIAMSSMGMLEISSPKTTHI